MVSTVVIVVMWRLNGDLHCHWIFLVNWEVNVFLMDHWSVDWDMDWVSDGFLNDVWNLVRRKLFNDRFKDSQIQSYLLNDIVWLRNGHINWNMNMLFNLYWIRSEKFV